MILQHRKIGHNPQAGSNLWKSLSYLNENLIITERTYGSIICIRNVKQVLQLYSTFALELNIGMIKYYIY